MTFVLKLGCWGREIKDFTMCKGIENTILVLSNKTSINNDIINFLDNTYGLFDKPLYNNIHTAIFNIQNRFSDVKNSIFNEERFKIIEDFCIFHNKCGLYLRLDMED